ncbi:exodeoxyribonuclease VII large subunit [Sphingosinicella sp. LHD-64]|uniref:exodeoxyribonuclease VII large subunit n=1 Tax=Sphingosinicella sp. LHD-64 TaxID=3072139 RepID=UPI00280E0CD5|nr:exodeoxyribonuclease VII large subunit [Sphingosinicella sp. LHD-64]MDQ8756480.1 exodeoxyribonuclease VII large subunit [Sphingosinicella sp. LHD-64]
MSDDFLPDGGLLASEVAGDNAPALSVSELSFALKRTVEGAFDHVRVRGEISGFKRVASGHCYFTLKDEAANIDAVIWRGQAAALRFRPEDGIEVIATGRLTTYPARSRYQIVVERLELAGQGALMALLDRRRQALAAEGLFDEARKRPLPFAPRTIGVVTSPTGAVIRDILHRLEDRFPVRVVLWPVPVQGDGAAEKVAAAVRGFNALPAPPDLLIVARGGGSIEDLWAFNEEVVVRAVAASAIPTISAVGHETDTTLCDFAADRRAPTPTAAAELAVPVRAELIGQVRELGARAERCARRTHERAGEQLQALLRHWPAREDLLAPQRQRLDDLGERLPRALRGRLDRARGELGHAAGALRPVLLRSAHERAKERIAALWRIAEAAHPERPLRRGYALVKDRAGHVLTSAAAAREARLLGLVFHDGAVDATVGEGGPPPPRRGGPAPPRVDQPKLL